MRIGMQHIIGLQQAVFWVMCIWMINFTEWMGIQFSPIT